MCGQGWGVRGLESSFVAHILALRAGVSCYCHSSCWSPGLYCCHYGQSHHGDVVRTWVDSAPLSGHSSSPPALLGRSPSVVKTWERWEWPWAALRAQQAGWGGYCPPHHSLTPAPLSRVLVKLFMCLWAGLCTRSGHLWDSP